MAVISLAGAYRSAEFSEAPAVFENTALGRMQLVVHRNLNSALDAWTDLEDRGICVNAQTSQYARLWFENISSKSGAQPVIVVGTSDEGTTQFVWPFEMSSKGGIMCLQWIGWEHANYQMGLHTLEFARNVTSQDMNALLQHVASISGANVALLKHQPLEWDGTPNPMALLPHHPSANLGNSVLLDSDFESLFRNRFSGKSRNTLRRKEKNLRVEGRVELQWAAKPEERHDLLDEFFRQKRQQFAEQGIPDAFERENVRAFYHGLTSLSSGRDGSLEIASLKVNDRAIAVSCGVRLRDKFETLLTSMDCGSFSRYSPGTILSKFQIEECCRRGLNFFDMGSGSAPHKDDWCDVRTALFDSAIAFDQKGYLLTLPYIVQTRSKGMIKSQPVLWSTARALRRAFYGKSGNQTASHVKPVS